MRYRINAYRKANAKLWRGLTHKSARAFEIYAAVSGIIGAWTFQQCVLACFGLWVIKFIVLFAIRQYELEAGRLTEKKGAQNGVTIRHRG